MISISADGSIKKWDSISGQASHSRPPHTLGLVSLSVDPAGKQALYNTLEGLTCLWDLEDGEVKGSFESYARAPGGDSTEPCTSCIRLAVRSPWCSSHPDHPPPVMMMSLSNKRSCTAYRHTHTAWSVSLNPKGGTYASTGGSGNVTIHSAESASFGERRATLTSGRSKFGMFCKHVGYLQT